MRTDFLDEALRVTSPAAADTHADAPRILSPAVRRRIFLYLGGLITLLAMNSPIGGLFDVPVTFFLKNRLGLSAQDVATFRLIAGIPLYLSFLFGLVSDTWHPLGMQDRGMMAAFSLIGAMTFLVFAVMPVTYGTLLAFLLLTTSISLFVASAQNRLTSALGQEHAMSGQVSAVWNIFLSIPGIIALMAGGALSEFLEERPLESAARTLYLAGAALTGVVALYCLPRPASVFDNVRPSRSTGLHPLTDLARLARHRPVYPALAIWLLWNFAPGSTTPLQYYLQNTLHAGDAQWGYWNAIFAAAFIPPFIAYAWLCQNYPLRKLLFWGTIVAVPQFVPLLFIHSAESALIAAAPIGFMGGIATAAYLDLIIRSCPPGLEGTTMMMSGGLYYVSSRFGDVLGTWLYDRYENFTICVTMITLVYALILPVLRLIPPALVATADAPASNE